MSEPCTECRDRLDLLREVVLVRLNALQSLTDERFAAAAAALTLQSAEIARRLEALNGEAERLRLMQMTYLPREVYEGHYTSTATAINELREFRAHSLGRQGIIAGIIAVLASLVTTAGAQVLVLLLRSRL